MSILKRIPTWITSPFLFMSLIYVLWFYIVVSLEYLFGSDSAAFASLLYLPHFVRVVATWFYGYRAFFGLVAGNIFGVLITTGSLPIESNEMAIIVVGCGSVVAALWLLDWARFLKPAEIAQTDVNWRALVFLGFFASLFNAIGSALIQLDGASSSERLTFMLPILVGDTGSVLIGLILLMFGFRMVRSTMIAKAGAGQ
ncbi:hypothetical protein A9Q96_00200 [Rhodobacterales bacterium 52_120_T64]|nr:hypothetical protein A9Q96_00200 [Rhodobacterales bacterium 52_120_T64]